MTPTAHAPENFLSYTPIHEDIRASIGERGTIGKTGRGEIVLRLATAGGGGETTKSTQQCAR